MASIDRPSSAVTFARLRALSDRLWRPLAAQRPAVKWGLAVVGFLALAAMSYSGAGSLSNMGVRYLASNRRFSSDDLIKICRALDKQRIAYRVDDQRRVEVASDQFEQAAEAFSKLNLGQHSMTKFARTRARSASGMGPKNASGKRSSGSKRCWSG